MDLDLPGIDDDFTVRRFRPQDRTNSSPWGAYTAEETKPRPDNPPSYAKSRSAAFDSGFNFGKTPDTGVVPDEFAQLLRGAGQEVHFDTNADLEMERRTREEVERMKKEELDPDEVFNMLNEIEQQRPRPSDLQADTRMSGDSTPTRARVTAKTESEIETITVGNSRRRPRTVGTIKPGNESRPTSAPVDSKTLLKAKTTSFDEREQQPSNRPSITKLLTGGEIKQIIEEEEDSMRQIEINDRASRQRTAEIEDGKGSLSKLVADERERLQLQHSKELERREAAFREQLEAQRRLHETQIASLEAVIKHQESLGTLAAAITANADTLNSLSTKFQHEKSFDEQLKIQELTSKQKALTQLEQRLLAQQQTMELDKQHMMTVLKRMQEEDATKAALLESEREQLRKDREQLHSLQELLRDQDRSRKEEVMLERQKVSMLRESLAREHTTKMQEVAEQLSELKLKQNLLDQQRAEMETEDLANRTLLQQKFAQLESIRTQINEMESKAARKVMEADDREKAAGVEWERAQRGLTALQADKNQLEEQARKLHDVSLAVQAKSLEIAQVREDLDKEKEEVMRLRQEAQSMLVGARGEQSRMEARRRELEQSARSIELLRYDVVRKLDTPLPVHREVSTPPIQELHQRLQDIADMKRPKTSSGWRPTFAASEYMRELQKLDKERGEVHAYATAESQLLLRTKLELETKFSDSLAASISPLHFDPSSKSLRDFHSSSLSG